jgi:UPF0716 protein FxsA
MLGYLIILFTILPALELSLLIKIGAHIGAGNTIFIIILTGVVGAYLARIQGFLVLQQIQDNINKGVLPSLQLMDGLMILVGGIVLLTPGFITDTLGFLLLIPPTRALIRLWLRKKFERMIHNGQMVHINSFEPKKRDFDHYDDIDIS